MNSEKKRLIWVDDEIEFLRAHILFMEEHGYEVAKATNGDDALAMIRQGDYDLVLLDEQMAGKDGLTTLEEIKEFDPNLPVVMVTKSEEERLMEAALGRNINGYLTKPVNPSQILSICKGLLHSRAIRSTQVTSKFVKQYSDNKAILMSHLSPPKWEKLFFRIAKWDVEQKKLKEHGLEETHVNQKTEAAGKFTHYIEDNYMRWFSKQSTNPSLCLNSIKRKVYPLLKKEQKVCLVLMSGFRIDQWLAIQPLLEPYFNIENSISWALLPTNELNNRSALFSGMSPRKLSKTYPELWQNIANAGTTEGHEAELLGIQLNNDKMNDLRHEIRYFRTPNDSRLFMENMQGHDDLPLITLVVDFMDTLVSLRSENPVMMEMVQDESSFREMAKMWFKSSNLFQVLRHFADMGRSIVITSDHGTVLVNQPAEVFCQEEKTPHPRVKTGKDISCDERHALFVETPVNFGLPGEVGDNAYAIAKRNYYFVYPNKFQYFGTKFKDQMVSGGLSPEEILVPLATLVPK